MKALLLVLTLAFVASTGYAQSTASAPARASAALVQPITLTWDIPLSFGTLIPSGSEGEGTAVMDLTGVAPQDEERIDKDPTCTGVTFTHQGGKHSGPAIFTVNGQGGYSFQVQLPPITTPVPVYITNQNSIQTPTTMAMTNFLCVIHNSGVVTNNPTGTIDIPINHTYFAVGATLHVAGNQPPGTYQAQFPVAVAYN